VLIDRHLNIASESERVKNAGIENNRIFLDQDLDRAEEGEKVEITVEALLTHLNLEQPLIFEIERGYLGSTDVELVYLRYDRFSFPSLHLLIIA